MATTFKCPVCGFEWFTGGRCPSEEHEAEMVAPPEVGVPGFNGEKIELPAIE